MIKESIPELNVLKSNRFLLWVSILSILILAPNTYFVYYEICVFINPYREIISSLVSIACASFILIYTLRKNYRAAKYYALFEAGISTYYYCMTIRWNWPLIPAVGFILILPMSLFYSSKEIDKPVPQDPPQNDNENSKMVPLDGILKPLIAEESTREIVGVLEKKLDESEKEKARVLFQADKYIQSQEGEIERLKKIIESSEENPQENKEHHLTHNIENSPSLDLGGLTAEQLRENTTKMAKIVSESVPLRVTAPPSDLLQIKEEVKEVPKKKAHFWWDDMKNKS